MKIIHTADWHLGQVLYGVDRLPAQTQALHRLAEIVSAEHPDALVVSGDVFHVNPPSASAFTAFNEAVVELHQAWPTMRIVITAGNHDSPARHEQYSAPWATLGVTTIGYAPSAAYNGPEAYERMIVDANGRGWIIAIPHVNHLGGSVPCELMQQLLDMVQARNGEGRPVVMMAHLALRGSDLAGHDASMIGGLDNDEVGKVPVGADYLALGHLHHEQFVANPGGHCTVRYAGSLTAVSFDEDFAHSVSVVTIDAHGSHPSVKTIDIETTQPLVTIGSRKGLTPDEAQQALVDALTDNDNPLTPGSLVRLNVRLEANEYLPAGYEDAVTKLVLDAGHLLCHINIVRNATWQQIAAAETATAQELRKIAPIELARAYTSHKQIEFTDEMAELFSQIVDQVSNPREN